MKVLSLLGLLMSTTFMVVAQEGFVMVEGITKEKISFESHSNLITIPVKINEVDFNFIPDMGATKTIVFCL
jgi:hypothetical protein